MKQLILALLAGLIFAQQALAAPWLTHDPVTLSATGTSATVDVGEKLGVIEKIRFQIDGATVNLTALILTPVKGDPIPLRIPAILKSGESSGQIKIPDKGAVIKNLKLEYRITEGKPAAVTFKIKPD